MTTGVSFIVDQWTALRPVLGTFFVATIMAGTAIYAIVHYAFQTRLSSKDAIIDELKSKLVHRTEERDEARSQLSPVSDLTEPASNKNDEPSERQTPSALSIIARDVSLPEALAYAELHEWGLRFLDAAATSGNTVNAKIERLVQFAADGEAAVWGKKQGNGVWVPIPKEFWIENNVEWFGLLRENARTEGRAESGRDFYSELMTSKAQMESVFAPPSQPYLQVTKGVVAPNTRLLQNIRFARTCFDEMDASEENLAHIRRDMAALEISNAPVWKDRAMRAARRDLLYLWERLHSNVVHSQRQHPDAPNFFRSPQEKSEMMAMVDDAVLRLDAGFSGREIPPAQKFGGD